MRRPTKRHNHHKAVPVCRNKKREITLGGIHKQVSVMLNIQFTLSGGEGLAHDIWHTTESRRIHSQELLLLALLLVLLATGTKK